MRLVVFDEIIRECKIRCGSGESSGDIVGRILETALEGHIYIAALPISASGWNGSYQRIGKWEIFDFSEATVPAGREGIELFLSPDKDDLLAFYKGHRVEEVHIVNYRTDFPARMQGIVDCDLLAEKRVFIMGAGSVGSKMAMHLARAGVGKFTIIDFDVVEAANLCRCEYIVSDIGRYKTLALQDRLLDVNPWAKVETRWQNVMDIADGDLLELIGRSDLVVSAADDPAAEQRLNALAHSLVPVVYPALYSKAAGGEVIFSIPGGPCYQCVVGTLRSASESPSRGEWDYTSAGDLKSEPGLGVDIGYVATIACKVALALLMRDVEGSDIARLIDCRRTAIFISNKKQDMYGVAFEPFGTVWAETEVNESCMVCQAGKGSDHGLRQGMLSRVRAQVAKAAPVDFPEIVEHKI